nr:3,4-dihydroxy-2-butanone-4-phosphate synthase [Pseudonocardia halophobica]
MRSAVEARASGGPAVVADDHERENEGDLIAAGALTTADRNGRVGAGSSPDSEVRCDCGAQLEHALAAITREGCGAVVYLAVAGIDR